MAEYGIKATELSAPQGAGASVVAPVQVQTGMADVLGSVGDVISRDIHSAMRVSAKQKAQKVVSNYVRDQTAINEALASRKITANEGSARSKALFSKYSESSPDSITNLSKAATALKGFSEMGQADEDVKSAADIRKSAILSAQNAGHMIEDWMDAPTVDATLKTHATSVRAQAEFKAQADRNAEFRAQAGYDKGVEDQSNKRTSIMLINNITGSNLEDVQKFSTNLGTAVRTGKLSLEDAKASLMAKFLPITATLQSAAGLNPELATPYKAMFDDVRKLAEQYIDPKANLESLDAQVNTIIARQKLVALGDPNAAKTVAISQLFGNNAQVLLSASSTVTDTITKMFRVDPDSGEPVPAVVGNKDVEKSTFKFLRSSLSDLSQGKYADNVKAGEEVNRTIRHTLRQVSETLGRGAPAAVLEEAASFFASSEYGEWSSKNSMKVPEQLAAARAFELVYEPTVIKGVNKVLENTFTVVPRTEPQWWANPDQPEQQAAPSQQQALNMENFSANFNGAGIVFDAKVKPANQFEARAYNETIRSLRGAQDAVNQLIRVGAHMQGTTDYAKYWEDNKHIFLPKMFSPYKDLQIGAVHSGMKYLGGDAKESSSWKKVE